MLAYLIAMIEIGFSIVILPQQTGSMVSSIATPVQMNIIMVFSSFVFGINQYSMFFFIGHITIIIVFGIIMKDYSQFLSSFVKIHAFLQIMFLILSSKYAIDILETMNNPVWILITFHLGVLFLEARTIELMKTQIQTYVKKKTKVEIVNKTLIEYSCPHCGYVYHSIPIFCVNCNRSIN